MAGRRLQFCGKKDNMLFMGIDPGMSGGIGVIDIVDNQPDAYAMPETEADTSYLFAELKRHVVFCLIEKVHSMPKQGVASSFKFGVNYGFLRGMLIGHGIPFGEVSPQKWQKAMECLTHGDKNISKARAQQLFPSLKITHATADALLIAEYCRRTRANSIDDL
jgi:crossover junction endodeoxyribonuclease RuvC